MWFKYFMKNIFKLIILIISIGLLAGLGDSEVQPPFAVFLIILVCVNVTTTYDLGNGYYLQIVTGGSIVGALIGFVLAYLALEWVVANNFKVMGIVVICYAINQLIETIKYCKEVHLFFTISGFFCAAMIFLEGINCFDGESLIGSLIEGGPLGALLAVASIILFLVNIIGRANEAYLVED